MSDPQRFNNKTSINFPFAKYLVQKFKFEKTRLNNYYRMELAFVHLIL
jgi:hypothetical protein